MDDGHILVGIIKRVGEDPRTFDVFDPKGLFLGSIDLGFRLPYRNIAAPRWPTAAIPPRSRR